MNFGNLSGTNGSTEPLLNLKKSGDFLDLSKHAPALKHAIVAGGWDASACGPSADLDLAAFMLYENGRIKTANDVIYFGDGHNSAPGITYGGDNRTGEGDGDDETIDVILANLNPEIKSIVFAVVIYEAATKNQTFGMVKNAFIRLLDANNNNKEVVRYNLTDDYGSNTAIRVCSLDRTPSGWQFTAIGKGLVGDLNTVASLYV